MVAAAVPVDERSPAPPGVGIPPRVLAVFVAACLATAGLGVWGALRWSLIPVPLDGRVVGVAWPLHTVPLQAFQTDDGRLHYVDRDLLDRMGGHGGMVGRHVEKPAWSRTVTIGGRTLPLGISAATWRTSVVITLLVAAALVRIVTRAHRRRPA